MTKTFIDSAGAIQFACFLKRPSDLTATVAIIVTVVVMVSLKFSWTCVYVFPLDWKCIVGSKYPDFTAKVKM